MPDPTFLEDGAKTAAAPADSRKKVLLLGDSIRQGYCAVVRGALADLADVRFPAENCRFTQYTYTSLGNWRWLFDDPASVDAVYWNNGHWDAAHWNGAPDSLNPPALYAEMTARIAEQLRVLFPRAHRIFATTTPMNPSGAQGANPRTNDELCRYNEAAAAALAGSGVEIDDLAAFCRPFDEKMFRDYCHFTDEGFSRIGLHVAETLRRALA